VAQAPIPKQQERVKEVCIVDDHIKINHMTSTDFALLCSDDEMLSSTFDKMIYDEVDNNLKELVFYHLSFLFFKIWIYHECRVFMEKWRLCNTQQKKGLSDFRSMENLSQCC
jgi:hypothetical protein